LTSCAAPGSRSAAGPVMSCLCTGQNPGEGARPAPGSKVDATCICKRNKDAAGRWPAAARTLGHQGTLTEHGAFLQNHD